MPSFEYKVVPAPSKGQKAKGVKTPEGRFALSVEAVLNEMGADGWEYLRAELLPSDERSGLTGTTVHWRNVLVFRRPLATDSETKATAPAAERQATGAEVMLKDNGVEELSEVSGMTTALKTRAEQETDRSADKGNQSAHVIQADFDRKDTD